MLKSQIPSWRFGCLRLTKLLRRAPKQKTKRRSGEIQRNKVRAFSASQHSLYHSVQPTAVFMDASGNAARDYPWRSCDALLGS